MKHRHSEFQRISVVVPYNPFTPVALQDRKHCLAALDVEKLMEWWPGTPHSPHRDPKKVRAIQRSLDWKRVVQIAAYLLQQEIVDSREKIDKYFRDIYEPRKHEPGREWPPKINKVVGYERSEFPTFSNVLLHVNNAKIEEIKQERGAAHLIFDENSPDLNFSVIDGQHRINGAYLAVKILQEEKPETIWEIPAEIFIGLDGPNDPPSKQAQIFIDVNFYQKKVDRSLVADLFPTARGMRNAMDTKERAQDIGRKLMLETGPLLGMIQIPGIRYGVKDVITLATLNGAIEDILDILQTNGVESLDDQTEFIAQCLSAWFEASGRFEDPKKARNELLSPQNVAYQGRVLISVLALIPAMLFKLKKKKIVLISDRAKELLTEWLRKVAERADLLENGIFIGKDKFKARGYHGAGGIGRFKDCLWAVAIGERKLTKKNKPETIHEWAERNRASVFKGLQQ
jgi:DGQHR domain-containing protein